MGYRRKKIDNFSVKAKMIIDKLKGKKIIILDIEETTFVPYILPIIKSLKEKTKKISYYIGTNYKGSEALKPLGVPVSRQFNTKLSRQLKEADIFLSPHIYGTGNEHSVKIHINHNQPVKYESYQKENFINFDVHFLTSPLHREQTENTIRMYGLENMKIELVETGYSKSDDLLSGKYSRENVLNELGLDTNLKTVIYAPSWDEGLSLRAFGEDVIEKLLDIKNINLIVKLHPISYCPGSSPDYEFYTGGIDWISRLKKYESFKNFRHITSGKIDPYLAASDLMITDLSSVALEFIMLDKPAVYIDCPEFFDITLKKTYAKFGNSTAEFVRNDPKANAGRHTGIVVYNTGELKDAVKRALKNPGEFSEKRKEFAKKLSYNPGKAADAASDAILKILGL